MLHNFYSLSNHFGALRMKWLIFEMSWLFCRLLTRKIHESCKLFSVFCKNSLVMNLIKYSLNNSLKQNS